MIETSRKGRIKFKAERVPAEPAANKKASNPAWNGMRCGSYPARVIDPQVKEGPGDRYPVREQGKVVT